MSLAKANRGSTQQNYHVGSLVWVPEQAAQAAADGKVRAARWGKGQVVALGASANGSPLIEVQTEEGARLSVAALECPPQNERDDTVDDLVKSDFLHEPGILHTLQVRYTLDMIYTYSGNILIAANPHKRLRHLYGARMMTQYRGVPLGELSPHAYAIAEQAFNAMMIDEQRQAILISGESGAGKTESAKMVMQYLAHRTTPLQLPGSARPRGAGDNAVPVEEQVLESNPLLEAFGNAKTSRNDNSSRFGKFVEIAFDPAGRVTGAAISTYLLERSRVVSVSAPERSYHIFYQLCAGASDDQKEQFGLQNGWSSFRYLAGSEVHTLAEVDDGEAFRDTMDAMAVIGLDEDDRESVLTIVAAVLHMGNITFTQGDSDEAVISDEAAQQALLNVATFLEVSEEQLLTALTTRAIETVGERFVKSLDATAASESRDALAKNLYAKLFDWLVAAINRKISALGTGRRSHRTIGILDIYGFESFKENSFEQLCINLANERLQQQFNEHVFKGEQEEYAREGIDWSYVEFIDNQDCLDLLEGSANAPAMAVFPLIDEACRLPRATYQDLAHAVRTKLDDHPRFSAPKRPPHSFTVDHYAGQVTYSSLLMMDKNKDFVIAEHAQLMASSEFEFVRIIFEDTEPAEAPPPSRPGRVSKSAYKLNSVGARFRKQLQGLMQTLNQCQPHYIRCIKPNAQSKPGSLAPPYVLEQLRAGGVLEAVRIACAGFPTRKPFRPFVQRYHILLARGKGTYNPIDASELADEEAADLSRRILQAVRLEGWQIGKSRVFLRAGQLAQMEGARGRHLTASAIIIQAAFRGLAARRELKRSRRAATRIQALWRGRQARLWVQQLRKERAVTRIAAAWRAHKCRKVYILHLRSHKATIIQSWVRMWLTRLHFRRTTDAGRKAALRAAAVARRVDAAVILQKYCRRWLACMQLEARRAEAARWRDLVDSRDALAGEREALLAQVADYRARMEAEQRRASELQASAHRLQSELTRAEIENQTLREQMHQESQRSSRTMQSTVDASRVAELEAAQAAAQAALMEEMELLRRQKQSSEGHAQELDEQVKDLQSQLKFKRTEVDDMLSAAQAKDRENSKLWEQVRAAAEEYHAEFAAKETTIITLTAEAEATRAHMQGEIEKLRTEMEGEVAAVQQAMQKRVEDAVADAKAQSATLRESREKNVHFSARVVALNSRVAQLTKQVKDTQAREKALAAEVEAAKQQAQEAAAAAAALRAAEPPQGAVLSHANGIRGTPQATRLGPGSNLASQRLSTTPTEGGPQPLLAVPDAGLDRDHEATLQLLLSGVVERRMSIINIQHGATPADSIGMPVAAWIMGECLLQWALRWRPTEIDVAAIRVRESVVSAAELEGLTAQAYWLSTTLALGAFLKVRSIGKRDCSNLFKLGDEMIQFMQLHHLLASSVAEMMPVNVAVLFSDEAKRQARQQGNKDRATNGNGIMSTGGAEAKSFEGLMSSPWKVGRIKGSHTSTWQGLLGGLSNVLECLRGEGAPPPAVRAVVTAALRYVDAELLNALVLRRDCCSISAIKALQSGLLDIKGWAAYMGSNWCGEPSDTERALEHSHQAVRYLLSGKDDCVRKATKGFDITPDLRRMCPSLTLQQIYKLTEHHHDDWITGGQGTNTIILLETLKRAVDSSGRSAPSSPLSVTSGNPFAPDQGSWSGGPPGGGTFANSGAQTPAHPSMMQADGYQTPASVMSHRTLEDEDSLLLDSTAAFVLPRKLLTDAARYFVQAPRAYHSASPGVSLLDRIEQCCRRNVQLPRQLRDKEQFEFLR